MQHKPMTLTPLALVTQGASTQRRDPHITISKGGGRPNGARYRYSSKYPPTADARSRKQYAGGLLGASRVLQRSKYVSLCHQALRASSRYRLDSPNETVVKATRREGEGCQGRTFE